MSLTGAKPILELISEKPQYLKLQSKEIAAFDKGEGTRWNIRRYPKVVLKSDEIAVTKLEKVANGDGVYVYYINEDKGDQAYFIAPNEFLASIIAGDKFEELKKKYAVAQDRANLRRNLNFTYNTGSDPEMFVEGKDGQLIPAFTFLPSKEKPIVAPGYASRINKIYWDGFQAEFDVTPNTCFSGVCDSIHYGLEGLLKEARKHDKHAKLSIKTVFDIPGDVMAEAKPEHVQFGCMPSFNVYDMKGSGLPGHEVPFRPAGGHMHFELHQGQKNPDTIKRMVRALDAILGVACVSMFANFDDPRRRSLYGLAGEYRTPAHGLEYRVLSNAWLMHPLTAHIVFDLGRTALMVGNNSLLERWQCSEAETIRIINECNVAAARKVLETNKEFLLRLIEVKYMNWWSSGEKLNSTTAALYTLNVIMNGAESVIKDPTNIEANWNLLGADSLTKGDVKLSGADYANSNSDGCWRLHSDGPGKNVMFVFKHGLENEKV